MGKTSAVATPTAVKQHKCCWCGQVIEAGEQYARYRYWSDEDASTVKMHAECFEAMQDEASEEGGFIEWMADNGVRPDAEGGRACNDLLGVTGKGRKDAIPE